jgi:eight-cysteine-cluster-containing protein
MKFLIFGTVIAYVFTNRKNKLRDDNIKCATGGCSGELCYNQKGQAPPESTCMWKAEYACLKKTDCKETNGSCQWDTEKDDYKKCMADLLIPKVEPSISIPTTTAIPNAPTTAVQ